MNVIVIVCDSFRLDHLGCYGNDWIDTSNIDELAQNAMTFDQAFSEGLPTLPTRTAMWAGRYTTPFRGWRHLDPEDILLAEWLWDKGFTSALITDVYHMHGPGMNYGRGFDYTRFIRGQEYDPWIVDESIDVSDEFDRMFKPSPGTVGSDTFEQNFKQYLRNRSVRNGEEDYFASKVFTEATEWLHAMQGKDDLFLWIDAFDPHEPWDPPHEYYRKYADPEYDGKHMIDPVPSPVEGYLSQEEIDDIMALYAGEIDFLDKWVGYFLQRAEEMGYFDNSLIIWTTDHGEPFGDHGIIRKCRPWNYEELVHVPFILRTPDGAGAGTRSDAIIQLCDVAPTIYDFLDLPHPPAETASSIMPLVHEEADNIRDYAYIGHHNQSWTIRDHTYSLHLDIADTNRLQDLQDPAVPQQIPEPFGRELYNVAEDPTEQNNLIAQQTKLADDLELKLRRFMENLTWEVPD